MSRGRFVDIFVEPDTHEECGYRFSMEEGGVGTTALVFSKTADGMRKSEDYKVQFKLHNRKGANLVFSKLADKVMWAMATDGPTGACPPEGSSFPDFYVDPTTYPTDDVLTVINTDTTVQCFSFCLNFVEKGTTEGKETHYVCYDPIGDNKDGGSGFNLLSGVSSATVAVAAIVAIVIIVAFVAYERGAFAY